MATKAQRGHRPGRLPIAGAAMLAVTAISIAPQVPSIASEPAAASRPGGQGRAEIGAWGFDLAGMDRSVDPGDDFHRYASDGWVKATPIPPDKIGVDAFSALEELSAQRVRAILEEQSGKPGSAIGDYYASFMDRHRVDALGHAPIDPLLADIDRAADAGALATVMGRLTQMKVQAPFWTMVEADDRAPEAAIVIVHQGGLGMLERQYYLDKGKDLDTRRDAYRQYLAALLTLIGQGDAQARAAAVFDFEAKLATGQWPQLDTRDPDRAYNRLSIDEIRRSAPEFPWDTYLRSAGFGGQGRLLVRQPDAIAKNAALMATTAPAVVRDYLKLRLLQAYAPYLSQSFVDAHFRFNGTVMSGAPQNSPEWKRGADLVSMTMGDAVGRIYVERHFPPEAKEEADRLVRQILAAWDRRLGTLAWMSPKTRERARAKLRAMVAEIGYPIRWRDYASLAIRRDDLFGNVRRAREFEHQRQLNMLGRPIDKRQWYTDLPAMGVNGYANHRSNQIVFSAGLLQPPFFDVHADPALNYGAIGAVIAHEIGHHFDDQGAKYDERGVLSTWWTPEDVGRFNALTEGLVKQYDAYEIFPGKFVSGRLTIGDNIGDLAGVTVAWDAYRHWLGGTELPVKDGLTGDQRFFLGWAQIWRVNYREAARMQALRTDVHAPPEQRVWIVRNLPGWYRAFNVQPGRALYLPDEKRVHIW